MTKVAFIVCYDDELYFKECMYYISWLKVPDGVETEIVGVIDADSMAAGYNMAMHETNAKYKVYLHQDVFILYEDFIEDIIDIFNRNPEYGMLGVIGSSKIIENANYSSQWNIGMALSDDSMHSQRFMKNNPKNLREAVAIDGMIMITQYDVEWREDIFNGFDFYDISQCMEFYKAGYKVGIPYQKKEWCCHVPSCIRLEKYDFYRKCFCEEYKKAGYYFEPSSEIENYNIKTKEIQKILPLIDNFLKEKDIDRAAALIKTALNFSQDNIQLCNLNIITEIIQTERSNGIENNFYSNNMTVSALLDKYTTYIFLLKRLEYNKSVESWNDLIYAIAKNATDRLEIETEIAEQVVAKDEQVVWKLKRILKQITDREFHTELNNKAFVVPKESDYNEVRIACSDIQKTIHKLLNIEVTAYCEKHQQIVNHLIEKIDNICSLSHIGRIDEDLYMTYLDTLEDPQNISLFANKSQAWLNNVLHYIDIENREPLVSVLLSVYNSESFIEDTIRSIMDQSYRNLQIIVVNDHSSDNSQDIIDKLIQEDKRIETIYLNENSNVCMAINMAYKMARGKYIALIGHDDIWEPNKIEKQVCFMEMYPEYAACFTLVDIIDDEKQRCNEKAANLYMIFNQRNRSQKEWIQTLLFVHNVFCAPSVLIRHECIKREYIYHFGIVQLQDLMLWLELLTDYPIHVMQERLTLYRKFGVFQKYPDSVDTFWLWDILNIQCLYLSQLLAEQVFVNLI